jgi:hypothetical protein
MKGMIMACVLCLSVWTAGAQNVYNSSGKSNYRKPNQHKGFSSDDLIIGGDIRLTIGQYMSLGLAPIIGYKLTDNFSAGAKIGYNYRRERYVFLNPFTNLEDDFVFRQNIYCASLWTRYIVFQNFFLHLEAEGNFYDLYDGSYELNQTTGEIKYLKKQVIAPSILVGVGIKQPISDRTSFVSTIVYDVLQDPNSFYQNQIDIRFGILVGF